MHPIWVPESCPFSAHLLAYPPHSGCGSACPNYPDVANTHVYNGRQFQIVQDAEFAEVDQSHYGE